MFGRIFAISHGVRGLFRPGAVITKAKRIPLVDLTPCVIDLTQED